MSALDSLGVGLLRASQVSELLQVSRQEVYLLAREGKLSCIHWGRSVRFTQADVDFFIESHRRPALMN